MIEKLKKIKARQVELETLTADPNIISDQKKYVEYMKELSSIADVCEAYDKYTKLESDLARYSPWRLIPR